MELRLPHIIRLYNVFLENDGAENCAQLIEEEFNKMIGMNDEHDCNVVSVNSLNIQMLMRSALAMIMMSPIRMSIFAE